MTTNEYGDLIEQWKADLIVERAKRRGFRTQHIDDAVQEIVLELLKFTFDIEKSNGAKEKTVVTSIIDRRLKMMRRGERRYMRRIEEVRRQMGVEEDSDEPGLRGRLKLDSSLLEHDANDQASLTIDCAAAIASLPAQDQGICRRLAAGCSFRELAAELGCDWHTAQKRVAATRAQIERAGIGVWLEAI
jgi:RNA polymerase sigma factor (sigma-70 family)